MAGGLLRSLRPFDPSTSSGQARLRMTGEKEERMVISVPSGNFGNLCAGLLAYKSGLPVRHFIAACNANDAIPQYLESGQLQIKSTVATLSNAMDVGNPSNFIRILQLFDQQLMSLKEVLSAYSISDEETKRTIKEVYDQYHYLLDPHGAVGFAALKKYQEQNPGSQGYFLETAHPVKFYDVVEPLIGQKILLPSSIELLMKEPSRKLKMKKDANELKKLLLSFQ